MEFAPGVTLKETVDVSKQTQIVPSGQQRIATLCQPIVKSVENGSEKR